jgi:hypothetical protein
LVESQFVLDPPFIRGSDRLFSATSDSIEGHLRKVRHLVEEGIADLQGLLNEHSATAKAELQRRLKAIRMFLPGDGEVWYYEADGTWDLLGSDSGLDQRRRLDDQRLRMVGGTAMHRTRHLGPAIPVQPRSGGSGVKDHPAWTQSEGKVGSIPIARPINPVDAVGLTGFPSPKSSPKATDFVRSWTRNIPDERILDAAISPRARLSYLCS